MSGQRRTWIVAGALTVAVIGSGAAIAIATGTDDDTPLEGSSLARATRAALEHTGGGQVIETEVGDDGAAYGVEIRSDDGSVVEVNLDESFEVIGEETDDDRPGEGAEDGD
jgi:uncharacterized membrane protein YkoI